MSIHKHAAGIKIRMEDAAIAIYTSGSNGNPQGILHDRWSFTNAIAKKMDYSRNLGLNSTAVTLERMPCS